MEKPIESIFVDPVNKAWRVSGRTPSKVFGTFHNKNEAVETGRQIAKKKHGQLIVHGPNRALDFAEDYASVER